MFDFFKKKIICEHEFEIIENKDFYDTDNPFTNFITDNPNFFKTVTYSVSDDIVNSLNDKNISKEQFLNKLNEILVEQKNREVELEKQKFLDKINERKAIGHYFLQRCKKCGKLEEKIRYYDPIKQYRYDHSFGVF